MMRAFSGCSSLRALDIGSWTTAQVTNMSGLFENCSSLQTLDIGSWNTESVTDMTFMYANSNNLQTLDIGGWNTKSVTSMYGMFSGCGSLQTLNLEGWNTSSVTDVSRIFSGCQNLKSLLIGEWNTSNVTSMSDMFSDCSSLQALDIGKWDTSTVVSMSNMFAGCKAIQSLNLESWNVSSVQNMDRMFAGCSALNQINLPNWNLPHLIQARGVFEDCSNLQSAILTNWNVPALKDMSQIFSGCSSLETIDIENWQSSSLTDISRILQNCSSLQSFTAPNWSTSSISYMNFAFSGCKSLQTLDIKSWDVSAVIEMAGMFSGCHSLEKLDLSSWNVRQARSVERMFEFCTGLTEVGLFSLHTGSTSTFEMLSGCTSLKKIDISHWDTRDSNSDSYSPSWKNLNSLEEVVYEESSKKSVGEIDFSTAEQWTINDKGPYPSKDVLNTVSQTDRGVIKRYHPEDPDKPVDFESCSISLLPAYLEYNDQTDTYTSSLTFSIFFEFDQTRKVTYELNLPRGVTAYKDGQLTTKYTADMSGKTASETLELRLDPEFDPYSTYQVELTVHMPTGYQTETTVLSLPKSGSSFFDSEVFATLMNKGFLNTEYRYLVQNGNFPASILVANKDSSFGTDLVSAYTNLYFRGLDGWKEIVAGSTTKEAARDVLLAYIVNTSGQMEKATYLKEQYDLVKELSSAMKMYLGKDIYNDAAAAGLIDDKNLLSTLSECVTSKDLSESSAFSKAMLDGNAEDVTKVLLTYHPNLDRSKVERISQSFFKSSTWVEKASKWLKNMGYAVKAANVTAETLTKMAEYDAAKKADQEYIGVLDYIINNSRMPVLKDAAQEVKDLIDENVSKLEYSLQNAIDAGIETVFDETLDLIGKKVPCVAIIKTAFDTGAFLGNNIFHVTDLQDSYDKVRVSVYLNKDLAAYASIKQLAFFQAVESQDEKACSKSAYSLIYVLNMLAQGRINAENAMQSYLDLIWNDSHKELLENSRAIEQTVIDYQEYWDMKNLLLTSEVASFSCPIDIFVKDSNGRTIVILKDGAETEGEVDGIRYKVEQIGNTGEFQKILAFDPALNISIEASANDLGSVDYIYLSSNEDGQVQLKTVKELPINAGDQIYASNLNQNSVLIKNGTSNSYTPVLQTQTGKDVTSIHVDATEVTLKPGDKKAIIASVEPKDAEAPNIIWTSSNNAVAMVTSDGVIEAKGVGTAAIQGTTLNGKSIEISVNVSQTAPVIPDQPVNSGGSSGSSSTTKPVSRTADMFRLYNPNSGEHFYTREKAEKAKLVSLGWKDEGIGWTAPANSNTPVYRLYNPNAGDHHYTMNPSEKNMLVSAGWKDEGIGWYSDDEKGRPLYRQYNPNARTGSHNYTTSLAENDHLVSVGWNAEGVAWYGLKR